MTKTKHMLEASSLRRVPLFREFEDAELTAIASAVTNRRYGKHQFIVREGDPGDTFFIWSAARFRSAASRPTAAKRSSRSLKKATFSARCRCSIRRCARASIKTLTEVEVGAIRASDFFVSARPQPAHRPARW